MIPKQVYRPIMQATLTYFLSKIRLSLCGVIFLTLQKSHDDCLYFYMKFPIIYNLTNTDT